MKENLDRKVIASHISPLCCRNGCKKYSTIKIEAGLNGHENRKDDKIEYAFLCQEHFEEYEKISDKKIIWLSHFSDEIKVVDEEFFGFPERTNWFVTPVISKLKAHRNWFGTNPKMARAKIVGELNTKELEKLI